MADNKTGRKEDLSAEELEQRELFLQADKEAQKAKQLLIDPEGNITEQSEQLQLGITTTEDPEAKYNIYYNGIRKLMRQYLPKGNQYKPLRQPIYDEANIFLNRGKVKGPDGTRGGDGRMTYQPDMQRILDETVAWVISKGTAIDLYERLWDLNESLGYDHQSNLLGK